MSSSPTRSRLAGLSLRFRLLVAVLALLGVVCAVVGVVTQVSLHALLVDAIDDRLAAAGSRTSGSLGHPGEPREPALFPSGLAAGTLNARIIGGVVIDAQILNPTGGVVNLPATQYPVLLRLPADRAPRTRSLADSGNYRLLAQRMRDGDILVTGLPLSEVDSTLTDIMLVETGTAVLAMLAAGVAGGLIVRRTLRPLRRVAATATRVSELPLARGEVALSERVPEVDTDTRTEVGQVGAALNRLLGHVGDALRARQASEMRVRQFVADASHELRTPLTAIRGYAELSGRFLAQLPPDVAHALRRVESESARMSTMVDDLLLLARLDSGRPLRREPVDLSQLVIDAASDARVAGPEHTWRLELPGEPVTVPGDRARLQQVLVNLLANARTHTPAGTTVRVALHQAPAEATIQVTDDGPGIPAALLPDVFERFARADTSRSRAAGSTGLGLAIVAAVVEAHHGRVQVISEPGQTVFTVRLPAGDETLDGAPG